MKALKRMPIAVAVVIMVVLMLAGIAFGNHNALSQAKAAPEAILTEVSAMAAKRATSAKNLLVVAKRNDVGQQHISTLEDAVAGLEDATNSRVTPKASKIADANQSLTFAATTLNNDLQAVASDQDKRLATGVIDDLTGSDKILSRQASLYNESLESVRSLYSKLPMRFIIGSVPEVYQ